MGCTTQIRTSDCFYNRWKMCRGVYWSHRGGNRYEAKVVMSRTGGACPSSGESKTVRIGEKELFGDGEYTVKVLSTDPTYARIEVWRTSELNEDEPEMPNFGFGTAEITQTNIGPGLIFNVGDKIDCLLRVMNTGDRSKIHGAVGLGYHDREGNVFFTGRYMIDNIEIPSGETFTWNPLIEVLHKDYAAREMTSHGPAMYFMSGHEENDNVIWDRSEYIPVELLLESGYVDPLDPEGVPDDWPEPVYEDPWDDFWGKVTPEPEEKEKPDLMLFIYIGFIGLIGYLLIRSQ